MEALLELNLTPKTRNETKGALCYVHSFICIIISVVWHGVLIYFYFCNKLIQASDTTLDMEVVNIESLPPQLVALQDSWKTMWNGAKIIASSMHIEI